MEPTTSLRSCPIASLLFFLVLSLFVLVSAQFPVIGPAEPILAMVGENTTLHCHLSPERNAEEMEVRWFRWRFFPAVLVYRGHQERPEEQMVAYRGRTTFMRTDISKGRVALIIHNVTAYDNGIYCCYFQEGRSYDQATMKLMVARQLQEELRWRRTLLHAADVVLDPDTAHPELFLSDDQRSVIRGSSRQSVPDNPERFDCRPCVLGRESFSSGKHYWEVEVENVMVWAIGVCRDSVERKGEALLVPQNGFWTLEMFGSQYRALSSPEKIIPLKERLHRIAVFLDCEGGDISFYNMRDRSHIYTCPPVTFTGPLRPFFRLGSDDSPLFICPAFTGAQGVTIPEGGLFLYKTRPISQSLVRKP